ncbi:hypothetical protein BB560_006329 [Smittium megazygosporum]|uniref:Uncharacterized protein n=1 Tax=Smittium megazygosporum TaxID=133381 RepID=A0A2T9Y9E1_9FUNG|nr:hypothetical protein BB560_006329 [Smittium megazygosporum]
MKFTVSSLLLISSGIMAVSSNAVPAESTFNKRQDVATSGRSSGDEFRNCWNSDIIFRRRWDSDLAFRNTWFGRINYGGWTTIDFDTCDFCYGPGRFYGYGRGRGHRGHHGGRRH